MKRDDIFDIAVVCDEAGFLVSFANTVENMTIERCAKLCEENCAGHSYGGGLNGPCLSAFSKESGGRHDGMTYAEAIRALKDDQ